MELEGFGASIFGKSIYVICDPTDAWIPWEFLGSEQFACKILISGYGAGTRCLEAANEWTAIFKPQNNKDWSIIATVIKGIGHNVLLVIDPYVPIVPTNFITFIDSLAHQGYITLTKMIIGKHNEILYIPDAIFFPILKNATDADIAYDIITKLPGRNGHDGFGSIPQSDWHTLVNVTVESSLGIVITDMGESSWTIMWHKPLDSHPQDAGKSGINWIKTGTIMLERDVQ